MSVRARIVWVLEIILTLVLFLALLFPAFKAFGEEPGKWSKWVLTVEILDVNLSGSIINIQRIRQVMINETHCKSVRDEYLKMYREKGKQVISRCTLYEGQRI